MRLGPVREGPVREDPAHDGPGGHVRGSVERAAGLTTWGELRSNRRRRVTRDVYASTDVELDQRLRIAAAVMYAGPTAVVTGWSAVTVHGLDVAPREMPVEIAVPGRRLKRTDMTVRRQRHPADEVVEVGGVRVTGPLRTAYDIATRAELVEAVVAADALGRLGGFTGADLAALARRHRGERGCRRAARAAELMDPGSESPMETRTRLVLVLAGLPRPVLQYEVREESGWVPGRVDLAWPKYRVAIEYDGRDHTTRDRRGRDVDRIDDLDRAGWRILVITARQVSRNPGRLVERVCEALCERGWVQAA